MVTSEYAIDYIKDKLLGLINSGNLKATCNPSKSTVSFYVNDIETINRPLLTLTLRLSDHHPTLQDYIDNGPSTPSEESNTNVSIEFYKPMFNKDGKRIKNKVDFSISDAIGKRSRYSINISLRQHPRIIANMPNFELRFYIITLLSRGCCNILNLHRKGLTHC